VVSRGAGERKIKPQLFFAARYSACFTNRALCGQLQAEAVVTDTSGDFELHCSVLHIVNKYFLCKWYYTN
jgi:hypothetical protein